MFDYLLDRSRHLAVVLTNTTPLAARGIEERLGPKGSVTVLEANRGRRSRLRRNVLRAFHHLVRGRLSPFDSEVFLPLSLRRGFGSVARSVSPTLTVITHILYSGLISELPSQSASILDPNDIYQRIHRAYADRTPLKEAFRALRFGYREGEGLGDSERRVLSRYNGVLAISRTDERIYRSAGLSAEQVGVLETCVRAIAPAPSASIGNKDIDLLFVGARFPGTEMGLAFLIRDVMSRLHGPLRLAVVGGIGAALADHAEYVPAWHKIEALGIVKDVEPFYSRSKIVVIPIPVGTGTSVKTQEAFSRGACVVATTAGARIDGVVSEVNCCVRDEPADFARAIEELLESPKRRTELGAAALATARRLYSQESVYSYLDNFISRVTGITVCSVTP